ncbi:MAG: TIGR01777 family oxidoreductase [Planctomycetota bacterium]
MATVVQTAPVKTQTTAKTSDSTTAKLGRILVTGGTGLVGSALIPALAADGHPISLLTRVTSTAASGPAGVDRVSWEPNAGKLDADALQGVEGVVHLAGDGIATGRWTRTKKQRIRESRVEGTRLLCEKLAAMKRPPKVLISASAIGYYGHRGDSMVDEKALPGQGFLPEVSEAWERATRPAVDAGIRVVNLRIGIVLSRDGGALQKMLLPFQLGLGGIVGHGGQYWSWVSLSDLVGIIRHALSNNSVHGPVNAVAPGSVTNREFTKALGRVLRRPTLFPLPAVVARIMLGEMADGLLLASARVAPVRLMESGYRFQHPEIEGALRAVLSRS